jgi:catecholate siderophore receptor
MRSTILISALLVCAAPLAAAEPQSSADRFVLTGRVYDPMRAPVPGARVDVTAPSGIPAPESTTTDATGAFSIALAPGRYTMTVAANGFTAATAIVDAKAGERDSRDIVLQIAGVFESVSVNATAGYQVQAIASATRTPTPLRDIPQSITVVTQALMTDQLMTSMADVMRYVPGISVHQGENNRDQLVIRGNSTSADFFVNGVRDDVQYYRDLYNLDRIEALKGPNAMVFGRGGAGGVINRVMKDAGFRPAREVLLQGGAFGNKRVTADFDQPLSRSVAARVNAMYENSGSFRRGVDLERYGVTPTLTIAPDPQTTITLRYEHLHDARVADRGITSFQGRPADVDVSTYYGNADASRVRARVDLASATIERRLGAFTIRNQTLVGAYDRSYQNFVPGAVTANTSQVSLSAYNNATKRTNVFNQTDATYSLTTGRIRHTLLAGAEVGRQLTDNYRNTGYFNDAATSILVPYAAPTTTLPVTFRQSATDADNHLAANVAAAYAQDQVELSRRVQVLAGVRFDRFDLRYQNNRNGDTLERPDNLVSPRAGFIFKPVAPLSLYTSYSVSFLPSSGDQFSSLTTVTQQLKPERFNNYEVGAKWDAGSALSLTAAAYRLDRTNTRSTDPNDPTRIVQTGSQRTNGYELGANGSVMRLWRIAGGYAHQDAFVTSATAAAREGATVAQAPRHTLSLWNHYDVHPRVSAGLGVIHRSDMFAAIDDAVVLPGYTRVDAAAYVNLTKQLRLQTNVENVFDRRYYANADSNTNISPGSPRAVRVALVFTPAPGR